MKGWGSVTCLIVLGLSIASGCGSRTGSFDDLYGTGSGDDDDDDSIGGTAIGGSSTVGGKPGKAGTSTGGKKPTAGTNAGGSSFGGSITGGTAPIGGTGFGGTGFGGTGFGGFVFGGTGGFGAVPIGGFGGVTQTCQECLFESCSGQFLECLQDVGCIEIIACAQRSGCEGIDCYNAATCKKVIDRWGGPAGASMNELLQTLGCAVNAGCPCSN